MHTYIMHLSTQGSGFRKMALFGLLFAFCFLSSALAAQAATINAASCNRSDVNAVINGPTHTAVNGDTINIPAGSCTWTSGITVRNLGVSIIGAGQGSTTLTDAITGGSGAIFSMTPPYGNATSRISSM